MKLSEVAIDLDRADEGVWVRMTGGWEAKIRSSTNPDAEKFDHRNLRKNRRVFARGDMLDPKQVRSQMIEKVVETLLVDWRGIAEDDGTEIKFSKEEAYKIFRDKRYYHLCTEVMEVANEQETFRQAALEDEQGN